MHRTRPIRLLILILLLATFALAQKVEDLPTPQNYVTDVAGVFSPQGADTLNQLCERVERATGAQLAVVTVKSLGDVPIDDYAVRVLERYKIGKKGQDNGVLVLIAPEDRKYRVEVGYGLEPVINDARAGDIGRSMVPFLRQNDYDRAALTAVQQVAGLIAQSKGVQIDTGAEPVSQPRETPQEGLDWRALIPPAIFILIFLLTARSNRRRGGRGGPFIFPGGWGGGGGGWGGGGWGGGGGGGGFGGFGGGSSGGGGASGSW